MATTSKTTNPKVLQLIRQFAQRLRATTSADYDPILRAIGDAQVVMIGEASHGESSRVEGKAMSNSSLQVRRNSIGIALKSPNDWLKKKSVRSGMAQHSDEGEIPLGFYRSGLWSGLASSLSRESMGQRHQQSFDDQRCRWCIERFHSISDLDVVRDNRSWTNWNEHRSSGEIPSF